MLRILRAGEVDLGTGVADPGGGGGGGEGEPAPASFDWAGELPPNLPDNLKQFAGKTFQDVANSAGAAQSKIGEQGGKIAELSKMNTELQAGLDAAKAAANGTTDPIAEAAMIEQQRQQTQRYQEATQAYLETGEVDDEFIDSMAGTGVRVDRDTLLSFMEYQRFTHNNMISTLTSHANREDVTDDVVSDVVQWMKEGESPFSQDERKGFDAMSKRENHGWFDDVLTAYEEEFGGAKPTGDHRMNRRKTSKKKSRGRPIQTPDTPGFGDTKDFQQALIENRGDMSKTKVQRDKIEKELIARRRVERGE